MKSTDELISQIKAQKKKDRAFLGQKEYACPPISTYLCDVLAERHLETKEVIRRLGLERSYGYQMFNGTRKPTRIMLIRLAVLLGMSLEETNRLLKIGRKEILYPRIREDAAVIFAVEKKMSLEEMDELLDGIL